MTAKQPTAADKIVSHAMVGVVIYVITHEIASWLQSRGIRLNPMVWGAVCATFGIFVHHIYDAPLAKVLA